MKRRYHIDVIAMTGHYRNPGLGQSLESLGVIRERQGGVSWDGSKQISVTSDMTLAINQSSLSAGEIGCAIAHAEAYRRLLRSKEEFLVVVEDDSEITKQFDLEHFAPFLKTSAPRILLLGRNALDAPFLKKPVGVFGDVQVMRDSLPPTGTFAYIVNRAAAVLLEGEFLTDGVSFTADWPLIAVEQVSFFYTEPQLFLSGQSESLIERSSINKRRVQLISLIRANRVLRSRGRSSFLIFLRLFSRHGRIFIRTCLSRAKVLLS